MNLPPERRPLCAPRAPSRLTRALTTCLGSAQIKSTSAAVQVVADPRVISQRSGAPRAYYPWMGSVAQPELSNTCVGLSSFTHIFPLLPLFCFKLESYMQIHMMHVLYHFDASRTRQWLQKSSAVPWSSLGDSVTPVYLVFLLRKSLSNLSCALSDHISATRCVFFTSLRWMKVVHQRAEALS
jgi:hypothetical protein